MPLYHFDTVEEGELITDDEGLEFTSLDVACDEAIRALGEIARDKLRRQDRQEITISIRDSGVTPLFTASLLLRIGPRR
jgi:hypothetical protein